MFYRLANAVLTYADSMDRADARLYLMACIGYPLATLVHAAWLGLFFHLGYAPLVYWNVGAATVWFVMSALLLARRDVLRFAFVATILLEIPMHAALVTYYTGISTAFWVYILVPLFVTPLVAFYPLRLKLGIIALLVAVLFGTITLSAWVPPVVDMPAGWQTFSLVSNVVSAAIIILIVSFVLFGAVNRAEDALAREFDRAEGLLKNILPDPIALRLKDGAHLIADSHQEVSVIFADIVNFTEASARLSPAQLVDTLNLVFSEFDARAARRGAEKIKTIGDAYMAVVGLPQARDDHAARAVALALDMLDAARAVSARTAFPIDLRIGVNSGPVVAGVIGRSKFAYDLWGDAVNVASRMEMHSAPGTVLITQATAQALGPGFVVSSEGHRDIKGKGQLDVFSVRAA